MADLQMACLKLNEFLAQMQLPRAQTERKDRRCLPYQFLYGYCYSEHYCSTKRFLKLSRSFFFLCLLNK